MGRKLALSPFCGGGTGSPSNTTSHESRPTSIPSAILIRPAIGHNRHGQIFFGGGTPSSRLGTIDMGRKLGALSLFGGGGVGSPYNTMSLGSRPTFLPSGILIYRAIWPQLVLTEYWGVVPLWGRRTCVPIKQNVAKAVAYLLAKFHLDPSSRLAAIHQRYRETGQDRTTAR